VSRIKKKSRNGEAGFGPPTLNTKPSTSTREKTGDKQVSNRSGNGGGGIKNSWTHGSHSPLKEKKTVRGQIEQRGQPRGGDRTSNFGKSGWFSKSFQGCACGLYWFPGGQKAKNTNGRYDLGEKLTANGIQSSGNAGSIWNGVWGDDLYLSVVMDVNKDVCGWTGAKAHIPEHPQKKLKHAA